MTSRFIDDLLDSSRPNCASTLGAVFSTGMSNGGADVVVARVQLSDRITAVAPVAGVEFYDVCEGGRCRSSRSTARRPDRHLRGRGAQRHNDREHALLEGQRAERPARSTAASTPPSQLGRAQRLRPKPIEVRISPEVRCAHGRAAEPTPCSTWSKAAATRGQENPCPDSKTVRPRHDRHRRHDADVRVLPEAAHPGTTPTRLKTEHPDPGGRAVVRGLN